MPEITTSPRIYVASLSDYNAGRLHGAWIDAAQDADDIHAEIQQMLKASPANRSIYEGPAEETAIHDYEGFGSWRLSEYESIETVAKVALAIEETHAPADAFLAWIGNDESVIGSAIDAAELVESFEESYSGEWDSFEAYAIELVESCGTLPNGAPYTDEIAPFIDWESVASYFEGDYWTHEEGSTVYVFRST